jgi:hypothetical protein
MDVLIAIAVVAAIWLLVHLARVAERNAKRARAASVAPKFTVIGAELLDDPIEKEPTLPSSLPSPLDGSPLPTVLLPRTNRDYLQEVAGESHYQEELRWLAGEFADCTRCGVMLVPEPENPYDSQAVSVRTFRNGKVGYLPRTIAGRYQRVITEICTSGRIPVVVGKLLGDSFIGIYIDLAAPTVIAKACRVKYQRRARAMTTLTHDGGAHGPTA